MRDLFMAVFNVRSDRKLAKRATTTTGNWEKELSKEEQVTLTIKKDKENFESFEY